MKNRNNKFLQSESSKNKIVNPTSLDSQNIFAARIKHVESPIRWLTGRAKELEKQGKKILYANIGDPLKYDFETPQCNIDAMADAVKNGHNYYADSQGDLECREAIVKREKRINNVDVSADNVIVTTGVSEAVFFLCGSLIDNGDEALIGGPGYPPYISIIKFFGGNPVYYKTNESNDWQPDISDVEKKITKRTKFLLMINPNNPTGAVYDKKTVKEMINLAGQHDLILVSDEIYDVLAYGSEFHSTASLTKDVPIVGFNGFSKSSLVTGWRLGYCYFANSDEKLMKLREYMIKLCQVRLCASTPVQKAVIPALSDDKHWRETNAKLKARAELSYKRLNEIPGVSAVKPKGAFYIFPRIDAIGGSKTSSQGSDVSYNTNSKTPSGVSYNKNSKICSRGSQISHNTSWKTDKEFVLDLLNTEGVLAVNGSGFGGYGDGHIRIVILPQESYLNEIYDRIEKFLRSR